MDFITWWFTEHWILSTLFTPGFTFLWCVFKGDMFVRTVISLLWYIISNANIKTKS